MTNDLTFSPRPPSAPRPGLGALPALLGAALLAAGAAAHAAGSCQARSGAQQVPLVELYTSEGCNSCPPADRWLSTLRAQPGVLAAAFHVDYWDQLGWPDRFGQPAFSARQRAQQPATGARFVYTPQVVVNGRDWRGWPALPAAAVARVQLQAERQAGDQVRVTVQPLADAPPRLGLWWALLEDGHRSAVKAGENRGETLLHDHVVRRWTDAGSWRVGSPAGPRDWTLAAPSAGEPGHAARLLLVVTDAATGWPLQALQLDC
jgi:hypothetical protein